MRETNYEILGLSRKPSREEMAHAYLALALKWWPDRHQNKLEAEQRFVRVTEAFCVLVDTKLRFGYDRALKEYPDADEHMRVPIDFDKARIVLTDMLEKFADNRLATGGLPEQIYKELVERNCPNELAEAAVGAAFEDRKQRIRAAGMKMMWHGLAAFSAGSAITIGTLWESSPGGAFALWYGPIIFGAMHLSTALWCLHEGKEPPPPYSLRET